MASSHLHGSERREISRTDVTDIIPTKQPWLDITCDTCGRKITLRYNGGELDQKECCGRRYELEAPRIDLVISESA